MPFRAKAKGLGIQKLREGISSFLGRQRFLIPFTVLTVALLLTLLVTMWLSNVTYARDELRFRNYVGQIQDGIEAKLASQATVLRATAGMFAADPDVTAQEFQALVNRLALSDNYPGTLGVGFSQRVPQSEFEAFEARMQEQNPGFRYWSDSGRVEEQLEYHSIVYLEPPSDLNLVAMGYDMFSNPVRREAMEKARDLAEPQATGPLKLVQEQAAVEKQPGFLIYVPVYRGGDVPSSQPQRREKLLGFVYSPLRAHDFVAGAFADLTDSRVAFRLHDAEDRYADDVLYQSVILDQIRSPDFTHTVRLEAFGRVWEVYAVSTPTFDASTGGSLVAMVAMGGLLCSLLLFGISWMQAKARDDAEQAALQLEESQRALFEEEQRYRAMITEVRDYAIFMLGADATVASWNVGVERMLGYTRSEFIGMKLDAIFPRAEMERGLPHQELERAATEGRAREDGWRVRKDGSLFWASGSTTVLRNPDGSVRGYVKVMRDLTEQKQHEEALRNEITARRRAEEKIRQLNTELEQRVLERTQQLEIANKELESFCYSVSHDMRTPLRGMVATARFIVEDYGKVLDEQGRRDLEELSRSAQRAAQLVNDLLEFSRIGRKEITRHEVNLSKLAKEVAAEVRRLPDYEKVAVRVAPNLTANGDPELLRFALENLLENACKYRSEVREPFVEVGCEDGVFFVKDNGIGFDPDFSHKLFLPFERLHRDINIPGTGIGLANVKRIVELHGGQIWAQSSEEGSTFFFTLGEHDESCGIAESADAEATEAAS